MSDLEIINLYNKGYSRIKIANIYKNYERLVYHNNINLKYAISIIDYIIYSYNKSVYGDSRRLQF